MQSMTHHDEYSRSNEFIVAVVVVVVGGGVVGVVGVGGGVVGVDDVVGVGVGVDVSLQSELFELPELDVFPCPHEVLLLFLQ